MTKVREWEKCSTPVVMKRQESRVRQKLRMVKRHSNCKTLCSRTFLTRQGAFTMEDFLETIENIPSSVYYGGVFGSILVSLGLFLSGKRHAAIFVGLWAPTILNLGLYNKLLRPSQEPGTPDIP